MLLVGSSKLMNNNKVNILVLSAVVSEYVKRIVRQCTAMNSCHVIVCHHMNVKEATLTLTFLSFLWQCLIQRCMHVSFSTCQVTSHYDFKTVTK